MEHVKLNDDGMTSIGADPESDPRNHTKCTKLFHGRSCNFVDRFRRSAYETFFSERLRIRISI
jgi:hypothetical protein